MSSTLASVRYDCDGPDCEQRFSRSNAVAGSFCSTACRDRHRGHKFLRKLKHDHRFCSTCFRPRKVVYRPADADCYELRKKALIIRESFVGFEHLTEHADTGIYGIECICGTVDHQTAEPLYRDGAPYEWFMKRAVGQLREEGAVDYRFDVGTFADALWADDDFALAVGKALSQ